MGFEALRLPHLEFLAEADEGNMGGDAGMLTQALRQDGAPVLIDGKDFAGAEQSGGEMVALVGIRRQVLDQSVDLVDEALAASVERGCIERGIAVDAVEA